MRDALPHARRRAPLIIGVGNPARCDDAAGLIAARRLRERGGFDVREHEGEPVALLDLWAGADAVIVLDAVRSGREPGFVHRLDASASPVPAELRTSTSTHAFGLAEAIELARALDRLPPRVVIYGIEGERFEAGTELSAPVAAAIESVVASVTAGAL